MKLKNVMEIGIKAGVFRRTDLFGLALLAAVLVVANVSPGLADTTTPTPSEIIERAITDTERMARDKVDEAIREMERIRDVISRRRDEGDTEGVRRAEEDFRRAERRVNDTKVQALAEASGESPRRIRALRESGMGWGRIAKELGVHPGVVGQGKGQGAAKGKGNAKGKSKAAKKSKGKKK